jgi:hypothetical protein
VFKRPHRLRYEGRFYQLEVRSKRRRGFWIIGADEERICLGGVRGRVPPSARSAIRFRSGGTAY